MTRRWFALLTLVLTFAAAAPERGMAQGDPVAFINQLGTQAIQVLGKNVAPAQRLQRFRELFASISTFPASASSCSGATGASRRRRSSRIFSGCSTNTSAQAYSARLAEYAGEPFRAIGARPDGDETVVASEITRTDGNKIRVDWHLVDRGGWKITDAYVAGVSMKVTQRDEFASVIQQGGGQVSYLFGRLRQKVGG